MATMRLLPIAYEDAATPDGRIIDRGALWWEDADVRLVVTTLGGPMTIGIVTNIRREDDRIMALLSHPIVGLGPGIDLRIDSDNDTTTVGNVLRVHEAQIRAVTLSPTPAWPDLLITP